LSRPQDICERAKNRRQTKSISDPTPSRLRHMQILSANKLCNCCCEEARTRQLARVARISFQGPAKTTSIPDQRKARNQDKGRPGGDQRKRENATHKARMWHKCTLRRSVETPFWPAHWLTGLKHHLSLIHCRPAFSDQFYKLFHSIRARLSRSTLAGFESGAKRASVCGK